MWDHQDGEVSAQPSSLHRNTNTGRCWWRPEKNQGHVKRICSGVVETSPEYPPWRAFQMVAVDRRYYSEQPCGGKHFGPQLLILQKILTCLSTKRKEEREKERVWDWFLALWRKVLLTFSSLDPHLFSRALRSHPGLYGTAVTTARKFRLQALNLSPQICLPSHTSATREWWPQSCY